MVIKGYHTAYGIFNASDFMEDMSKKQQKIRFSGAGASHQNGEAERSIKTVITMVRTVLIQDGIICPDNTLSTDFWPITVT